MRAAGILFTVTAAIAVIIFTGICLDFLITSKGEILPFYDENGELIPGSIAEKTWVEINGAENGMILRGKNVDNPVLLFLSGGPGVPQYWLNEYYPNELEEHYTVCWWDYYGEGLSWQPGIAPGEITMQRLEEDGVSVAEYLKERFGKEKIYLMAHSAGTPLGFKLAKEHPELFYAYYGMGQIAEGEADRYDYGYAFLKQTFTEKQDKRGLSRLEALVSIEKGGKVVPKNPDTIAGDWEGLLLRAGCGTTREMRSDALGIFFPQMRAGCYTFREKLTYWRGKALCAASAYHEQESAAVRTDAGVHEFEIPVYFLMGYYDYTCPTPLAKDLYDTVSAPDKGFYIFEGSAHSPLWEENEEVLAVLQKTAVEEG